MFSQTIAAADPAPFQKPRFIRWPSVCDTSRTNWLNRSAVPHLPLPLPRTETFTIDVGAHISSSPLLVSPSPPRIVFAVTRPDQQAAAAAHTFSADAGSTAIAPEALHQLYTSIDVGSGIPAPAPPAPSPRKNSRNKKRGRPAVFDDVARARLCGMIESGSTVRYAAKRIGIDHRTVLYACRTDPAFAQRLRRAEQDRDQAAIGRIHNAGEKSWRAAAWLLERIAPQEFSRRGLTDRAAHTALGKRQFKKLVTNVAKQLSQPGHAPVRDNAELPQPKPRQLTDDAIEAKIVELLEPMDPNQRFDLMYRLGY